jgi:molecular chaperone DnaK (HSP70)
MQIAKLKENAENYLGKNVKNVILSVPAYFDEEQRQAIKVAATLASIIICF